MLTAARARDLFVYDAETGVLRWRIPRSRGNGYGYKDAYGRRYFRVKNKLYLGHRIIWLLVHGEWPKNVIDHIDGDPSNNRLSNLRDVTVRMNQENMRRPPSHNKTGFLGVHFDNDRQKFSAHIQIGGKSTFIGRYPTPEEAHAAYLEAKRQQHSGCTI